MVATGICFFSVISGAKAACVHRLIDSGLTFYIRGTVTLTLSKAVGICDSLIILMGCGRVFGTPALAKFGRELARQLVLTRLTNAVSVDYLRVTFTFTLPRLQNFLAVSDHSLASLSHKIPLFRSIATDNIVQTPILSLCATTG